MPVPTWTVGEVLASADVNSWFVPLAAVKGSNQSVTSSTTLVNDTALLLPVASSATYFFELFLYFDGGTTGSSDLKIGWTVPASTLMKMQYVGTDTSGAFGTGSSRTQAAVISFGTNGLGTFQAMKASGSIVVSSTAGNVQLQWAQGTSSGTATTVYAGSYIAAQRIA